MSKIVWLSTFTMLRACDSVAQATLIGAPGDFVYKDDGGQPASKPSHAIVLGVEVRKFASKIHYAP